MSLKSVKGVPYLFVRNGIYYFRRGIPERHRKRLGPSEFYVSLKTGHRAEAMRAYARVYDQTQRLLDEPEVDAPYAVARSRGEFNREAVENAARAWLLERMSKDNPNDTDDTDKLGWEGRDEATSDDVAIIHHKHRLLVSEGNLPAQQPPETHWLAQSLVEAAGGKVGGLSKTGKEYRHALKVAAAARRELAHRLSNLAVKPHAGPYHAALFSDEKLDDVAKGTSRSVEDVVREFLGHRRKRWKSHTQDTYAAKLKVMADALGARKPINSVTREDVRALREVLASLPRNFRQRYPHCTPAQAADLAQRDGLKPISAKTVNTYLDLLSSLFSYAELEEYVDKNPAKKQRLDIEDEDSTEVLTFSDEDLDCVFRAPLFRGCVDDRRNYAKPGPNRPRRHRFWVPVIALFSGMRLSEICQLQRENIVEQDGVLCFDVASLQWQRRKTANSRRLVPVHPELTKLGFDEYVAAQPEGGPLFPELPLGKNGSPGDPMSKWFANFLDKVGLAAPGYRFHSFRHTWRTALRNAQVSEELACRLGGWKEEGLHAHYGDNARAPVLLEAVSKVRYDRLDLDSLN